MEPDGIFGQRKRICVVVPNSQARDAVAKALQMFKFHDILEFSSPYELLSYHGLKGLDWIITETFPKSEVGAVQLLESMRTGDVNPRVKVSFLIHKPEDNVFLSRGFELGLLSTHMAKYSHLDLMSEFGELHQLVARYQGALPLVAASYARSYLNETGKYESRFSLELALSKHVSFHPDVLFHLAEAEFVHGKTTDAVKHLKLASQLAPEYVKLAESMQQKFLTPAEAQTIAQTIKNVNIFGFNSVLLVDRDSSSRQALKNTLDKLGFGSVFECETGEEALKCIKKQESIDLIFSEWRLGENLSGSALIQRIRQMGYGKCRVVVVSSVLKKTDERLLEEIGVEILLPKPLQESSIIEALIELKLTEVTNAPPKASIRRIHGLLSSGNLELAEPLVMDFLNLSEATLEQKLEVRGYWLVHTGDYQGAIETASQALAIGHASATVLATMGRALIKLKDYKNASIFLERAEQVSPDHIQRLLDLSEAKLGQDQVVEAGEILQKALQLDPTNEWVILAECKISIENGETQKARMVLSNLESGPEIASQMNNRAIALAGLGRVHDSIELYKKTLEALPISWKHQVDKVTYNLGLAHAKGGDYAKAEQILRSVSRINVNLADKAEDLADRIKSALEKGVKIQFHSQELPTENNFDEKKMTGSAKKISSELMIKPGDLCLWGIFSDKEAQENKDLLSKVMTFKTKTG